MSGLDKIHNLPIYQKAELICVLVESLLASLPEDDEYIQAITEFMRTDSMIILAKIAGAEVGNLYSIRMQNAAIIRQHAINLYVQIGSLPDENYQNLEYVNLIRKEIDELRLLFIGWVAGFDSVNHIWDDWELFNPPGSTPPTEDDYNEPFNLDDFLDDDAD